MKVQGPVPTAGLRSLLEFEAIKHGIPIRYEATDLRHLEPGVFVAQVEIFAHQGEKEMKFLLEHQGVGVEVKGDVFYPEGKLILVEDQPVAVVKGRYLFLAFAPEILLSTAHPDSPRLVNSLVGQILDQAMPELMQAIRSHDFQGEAALYGECRVNADHDREQQWKRDLRSNEYEIEQKAGELRELYRKNDELRRWIKFQQDFTHPHRRRIFQQDFLALMKLVPAASSKVEFDESEIRITTNEIIIDHDCMDYEMGSYRITINFRTLDLRISSTQRTDRDFPHPHVSTDGVPCLGNLAPGVQRLLAEGDFASLIQVLLQFLQSYNPHNPYLKLEYWDPNFDEGEEERDRYEHCYENSSSRECVSCGDEDCPYSYEAEENCFENSVIRDCISCGISSCTHQTEAVNLCREEHNCWECRACNNSDCCIAGDEDECHESSDGQMCGDCDQPDCRYFPEPEEEAADRQEEEVEHETGG